MDFGIWLVALPPILLLAFGIRIASEDERFIVTTLGRFNSIVGPGLLFKSPFASNHWKRVRVGDLGSFVGESQARFGDTVAPVTGSNLTPQTSVIITSFRDGKIWVSESTTRVVICEKCGHENQIGV